MASHNWKDRAAEDLSDRGPDAPLVKAAHDALWPAKSLAADCLGRARSLARE